MSLGLLKTTVLTFTRFEEGNYDVGGTEEWVDGTPTPVIAEGSLQPFREGTSKVVLPEGTKTQDARLFYTKTLLRTEDEFNNTVADTTVINGATYEVFNSGDWNQFGLSVDHFRAILIRRDKDPAGVL